MLVSYWERHETVCDEFVKKKASIDLLNMK